MGGNFVKIIVCGGREYGNWTKVRQTLANLEPTMIIQGGCRGADELAKKWAEFNNVECVTVNAQWGLHGKSAGPIRNRKMCDEHSDAIVVAFPGGSGTKNMVDTARILGMEVIEVTDE
jgi:predicted Rossmann-fold nucleotide-binding protein